MPYRSTVMRVALALVVLVLAGACNESRINQPTGTASDTESTATLGEGTVLPMPERIAQSRAIDFDQLYVRITVERDSGPEVTVVRQGTPVSVQYRVNRDETFEAFIDWFERLPNGTDLLLSTYTVRQVVQGSVTLNLNNGDYESEIHDDDADGYSNLTEQEAGSDPQNSNNTPQTEPDVIINSVDPASAPVIDGLYDSIYTSAPAQFNDVEGARLNIDNLMIDRGASRPDGTTEFRWFAMHDNTYLYIYVSGEEVSIATPFRDSPQAWNDDAIEIFIDGDNSKGTVYDGIDDRQIIIPLLTSPTQNFGSNTTYFEAGEFSAPLPPIQFATRLGRTRNHTWEVRLPLAEFGILPGRYFGIDIQINEDNDGLLRDSKWGWKHPSREFEDVDNTYQDPSYMGTAVLD